MVKVLAPHNNNTLNRSLTNTLPTWNPLNSLPSISILPHRVSASPHWEGSELFLLGKQSCSAVWIKLVGGTMHECKATCKYAFQDNNCVWLGGYRRFGIAASIHNFDVSPTNLIHTAEQDCVTIRNNSEPSQWGEADILCERMEIAGNELRGNKVGRVFVSD